MTGTARAQEKASKLPPKLPQGAFCARVRADSESAHESGPRGVRRREITNLAGSNPQPAKPQSAQSLAI
eukprot:9070811-Alexandrium_andersonii.AAC.1